MDKSSSIVKVRERTVRVSLEQIREIHHERQLPAVTPAFKILWELNYWPPCQYGTLLSVIEPELMDLYERVEGVVLDHMADGRYLQDVLRKIFGVRIEDGNLVFTVRYVGSQATPLACYLYRAKSVVRKKAAELAPDLRPLVGSGVEDDELERAIYKALRDAVPRYAHLAYEYCVVAGRSREAVRTPDMVFA